MLYSVTRDYKPSKHTKHRWAGTDMNRTASSSEQISFTANAQVVQGLSANTRKSPKKLKTTPPADPEYSRLEEQLNAWSHILGAALGIAALVICLVKAVSHHSGAGIAAALIYGISLIVLYSLSASYHFTHPGRAKRVMRIFDHSTIFVLIAGCYTPFCLLALNDTPLGLVILILQWAIAAIGIGLNIWNMRSKAVKRISMALYVVMGWMVIISIKPLIASVDASSLLWLLAGGIAYTVGIAFYAAGGTKPYMHFVWHLFVLAGSAFQFISIIQLF